MHRDYAVLPIEEFGKVLLTSGDLDPVYIALYQMMSEGDIDRDQLKRFLLAYMLCYHCGAACWLSEKKDVEFFEWVMVAATNIVASPAGGRWPRSHERRHWRGRAAETVAAQLMRLYARPEDFITGLAQPFRGPLTVSGFDEGLGKTESITLYRTIPFSEMAKRVKAHHGFGDWSTFKLADLIDRLALAPVDFSFNDVVIYKDPVLAAEKVYRQKHGMPDGVKVKSEGVKAVFEYLGNHFAGYAAPPLYDRPVGLQEIETILCKYKSYTNMRYPLYNDIIEIHDGLESWSSVSETAKAFRARMPKLPQ